MVIHQSNRRCTFSLLRLLPNSQISIDQLLFCFYFFNPILELLEGLDLICCTPNSLILNRSPPETYGPTIECENMFVFDIYSHDVFRSSSLMVVNARPCGCRAQRRCPRIVDWG